MKPQPDQKMKTSRLAVHIGCLVALMLLMPIAARGKTLMLDFGPTVTLAADATKSPGHAVGAVPATEISWNTVTADTSSLVYSDGSAATGVSIDLGRSTAGSDTISFSDNGFSVNALGTSVNGGIYSGTSPVKDGIFGGSGGVNNLALGMRVNGLPAGTYTIYVHGRNSNTALIASLLFYGTNGASASTFSFSTNDATAFLLNSSPATTNSFVQGDNFGVLTVTLAGGESLYVACEGTVAAEMRGFFNAIQIYFGVPVLPAKVIGQPANRSVYQGVTVTLNATVSGSPPLTNQWRFYGTNLTDGPSISGATSNAVTLRAATPAMAGSYSLAVSNAGGFDISSNATLAVTTVLNTEQMTNIWSLSPGERPYLGTGSTERGLAFNPLTTNLLLVSRLVADPAVVVLDGLTGAEKYSLDVTGIPTSTPGVSLSLSVIGVADDGVVYGAGVTVGASSTPLYVFRWPNDSSNNPPVSVFIGDPAASVQPNLRWGDNLAVRGSGADTQILLAPGTGTNVVLLRTMSGLDFQTEIPPAVITVSGVGSGFARFGVAFGPGTNTFWAKTTGGALFLVEYDLNSGVGAVLESYSTLVVPTGIRSIGVDESQKFLAGVMGESLGDNVRLYDVSDLIRGPVFRDQEVFVTQNAVSTGTASISFGNNLLFALDENNGIKAFAINTNYVPPSVSITAQPADRTAMEGATVAFSALAAGTDPLLLQWRFNGTNNLVDGPNVSGAHSNVLTLQNITTNSGGTYSLFASNVFGTATSSNALLTVIPTFNTAQMTNVWNLLPGDRVYLGTNSTERGLAFNPVTTNLLLVSRAAADPSVVVLDATTGAEKRFLDVTGIPGSTPNVSLGLSTIGVGDDGIVYGAGVAVNASSTPYYIYRWPDDSSANSPISVFTGDPAGSVQPGLRWGDSLAVRGAGPETQILVSPGSGTNVVLLRTSDGFDFQYNIPPAVIAVSGVPSGFAQLGLAFGPGTNTFWAKTPNNSLYLIQFDLNSNSGTVLHEYSTNSVAASLRGISTGLNQKFLAGIALEVSHNVRLYEVSDLIAGPALRDQEVFATINMNTVVGGTGATAFGGNYMFALDSNNGLKAFLINTNYVAPLSRFPITSMIQSGGSVVLSWQSVAGHGYQVQSRESLSTGSWSDLGSAITATGSTTSFTNVISGASNFYRVQGQ